jgi:hypothetical protein
VRKRSCLTPDGVYKGDRGVAPHDNGHVAVMNNTSYTRKHIAYTACARFPGSCSSRIIKQAGIRCTPSSSEGSCSPFGGRHGWSAQSPQTKLCHPCPTLSAHAAMLRATTFSSGAQLVVSKPSGTNAGTSSFPDTVVLYYNAARCVSEERPHIAATAGLGPATIFDGSTGMPEGPRQCTRRFYIVKSSVSRAFRNGGLCI